MSIVQNDSATLISKEYCKVFGSSQLDSIVQHLYRITGIFIQSTFSIQFNI